MNCPSRPARSLRYEKKWRNGTFPRGVHGRVMVGLQVNKKPETGRPGPKRAVPTRGRKPSPSPFRGRTLAVN